MGDIVRAIEPETEADPAAIMISLLVAVGNAVGKSPRFSMNAGVHYANLFACVVGGTASAKGQSWGIVQSLMRGADPDWERDSLAFGLSSGEGLVDRVKDPEPDADAESFTFPEEHKLLCIETEFARVLTASRREGNTLSPLLRSAWDSQTLEVLTRGKSKIRASNAHISIIAHVTPEELSKLLSASVEIANGFANRFLWVSVRRSKSLPRGGNPGVIDAWVKPLAKALVKARMIIVVDRDEDAEQLWAVEYDRLTEERPGAFGFATSRAHAITLRLSILYAILDGEYKIRGEHLRAALAVWDYCEASASRIFGDAVGVDAPAPPSLAVRILDVIVKVPGIHRSDLLRAFREADAETMTSTMGGLESQGLAHKRMIQPDGGGRPAEAWYPGPPDDGAADDDKDGNNATASMFTFVNDVVNDVVINDVGNEYMNDVVNDVGNDAEPAGVNSFLPDDADADAGASPPNPSPLTPLHIPDTATGEIPQSQPIDEDEFFHDLETAIGELTHE